MADGANSVHVQLRRELGDYIKSQYFGKSPLLLKAFDEVIDQERLLYRNPFIESSPAYESVPDGIANASLPDWLKDFFIQLSRADLGVFSSPFVHQKMALEQAFLGKDLFVSTGTGSGKTECFMWPLLSKLVTEAHDSPSTWKRRGIRTIIMYPMNALVSDQVSRLRRLIGDKENRFVSIFRETCGIGSELVRRPQFGMYTGRTPYPGDSPNKPEDKKLVRQLERLTYPPSEKENNFYNDLLKAGKLPAKADMPAFLERLLEGRHIPDDEDAELITRFEMQQFCPDILITNYSMLEYMLFRPREAKIWYDTKEWLASSPENKLLFVIDEAHMYRGSSGGEVALLLRRLFHKLGIGRNRVQFILTTASMPRSTKADEEKVEQFACDLTSSSSADSFCFLKGNTEEIEGKQKYDIPFEKYISCQISQLEEDDTKLSALNYFWSGIDGCTAPFNSLDEAGEWLYQNLVYYKPFHMLMQLCRGSAVSLQELAESIFTEFESDKALYAIGVLLAIAPFAKNKKGIVLFPARMHMLFRGITGVYACTNPHCGHTYSDGKTTLGKILFSDGRLTCPDCGSAVYELYNDRRCGALYFKGYLMTDGHNDNGFGSPAYLWHYPGQVIDKHMKEIHLFIPPDGKSVPSGHGKYQIRPCYLDVKSGFIYFKDDSKAGATGFRKLYYCTFSDKGRPDVLTFYTCPHCLRQLSKSQLTSFGTKGNESFFNLIKAQFLSQPAVSGKTNDPDRLPNEGRKVLVFSDSRQQAARLARDMSNASDDTVSRQLFALAIIEMEKSNNALSLENLYGYICLIALQRHLHLFSSDERKQFDDDCKKIEKELRSARKRGRHYSPELKMSDAPNSMKQQLLQLFNGGYNTFYDSAVAWLEPTPNQLLNTLDELEDEGVNVSEAEFIEIFNAWLLSACSDKAALGHTIDDDIRKSVRRNYDGFGLTNDWNFDEITLKTLGWKKNSESVITWKEILQRKFLKPKKDKLMIDMDTIRPRFSSEHTWFRCERCSGLTPYLLRNHCPFCGHEETHILTGEKLRALEFWRKPIEKALAGDIIRLIDTEEHTAQLSHKDQRDDLWSKTEQYELRFQDLIQDNETPVDILSSTTTMEVGIDIGSLVAVGLRNIPPMRENYQQRAGRAGRRGASLSTIVTFCGEGPHDSLYFNNPAPMFRGDPRSPWIDITSPKLLHRHMSMIVLQDYLKTITASLDSIPAATFIDHYLVDFIDYLGHYNIDNAGILLNGEEKFDTQDFKKNLAASLLEIQKKRNRHPELFGIKEDRLRDDAKSLLDALYEDGTIPTYSFPKNVVSTYISDYNKIRYQVERGLDVAIQEYAPGRSIVVDKQTYQIGGLYVPGSEWRKGSWNSPAKAFIEDPNYLKQIITCEECGWFGLADDKPEKCPFCGNTSLSDSLPILKPWGFAPKDATSIQEVQLQEVYSVVSPPLYSSMPDSDDIHSIPGCKNIRMASRSNQRMIMLNRGNNGFTICKSCGAAFPGDNPSVLSKMGRPYMLKSLNSKCRHLDTINTNLGFDFITDMLVLEIYLDRNVIDTNRDNLWTQRAATSLAETLRLAASQILDIEFTELITGCRIRENSSGLYVDIYLYDSLSSGAGYSVGVADEIEQLLDQMNKILSSCHCENACHDCLKHYRNRHLHGLLDRKLALQLLNWARNGETPKDYDLSEQIKMISPLKRIMTDYGFSVKQTQDNIEIQFNDGRKKLIIYPAMQIRLPNNNEICVSDVYFRFALPYALQKIIEGMTN